LSKILVTGAAGFIGSNLCKRLNDDGHSLVMIDDFSFGYRENLSTEVTAAHQLVALDVRDGEAADFFSGVDCVIHLAGLSSLPICQSRPLEAFERNVLATISTLENARRSGVRRIIFASTSAVYENTRESPFTESSPVDPTLIYSLSKRNCEQIIQSYVENYGLDVVTLRLFNVYGPNQNFLRPNPPLMGYMSRMMINNLSPTFYSDGDQKRDYVYIDDVIDLIISVLNAELPPSQIINVCSQDLASVKDIYSLLIEHFPGAPAPSFRRSSEFWSDFRQLFESPYPLRVEIVEKEVNKYSLGSNHLARRLLNLEPKVGLRLGTSFVADHVKANRSRFSSLGSG